MEIDPVWNGMIWLIGVLVCACHLWFSAAITAVHALSGQLDSLMESYPRLAYYQKRKSELQGARVVELAGTVAILGILLCLYGMGNDWLRKWFDMLSGEDAQLHPEFGVLLYLLIGIAVLFMSVLLDSIGRGIGRKHSRRIAVSAVGFVKGMFVLLSPLRGIYAAVEYALCGKRPAAARITEEQILQLINVGNENGVIEEQQKEMINNIFEFNDIPISDVMTHRKELVAIDVEMEIADVVELARNENYSRMPVYQDNIDNIIGILNTKDLLGLIGCNNITGFTVPYFMREALFVPETAKCDDVLSDMSRKKMQMAIVIDEYGGTAGVVCMEDIREESVGSIQDEYDEEENEIHRITDSLYTIDGHADPEETLPALGAECPEEMDFDTMSGFVVDLLGRIPEEHENPVVQWKNIRFTVLSMEENWISKIKAEILPESKAENE